MKTKKLLLALCLSLPLGQAFAAPVDMSTVHQRAAQGDAEAQSHLGVMYRSGNGLEQDHAKALDWNRKAAEQGNAQAHYQLGRMHSNGEGVDQDHHKALGYYRQAAEKGNVDAMFYLGHLYQFGNGGVKRDPKEAMDWYRQAADKGCAEAQFNLGAMYSQGEGVQRDYVKSYMWMSAAVANGFAASAGLKQRDFVGEKLSSTQLAQAKQQADSYVAAHKTGN